MKKIFLFLLLCSCQPTTVTVTQDPRLGGVLFEDEKYQTVPFTSTDRGFFDNKSAKSLRGSFGIPSMDQGPLPACVCYTLAHALGVQRKLYFDSKCPNKKPFEFFSASYIFNQICTEKNCNSGVYMTDALNILLEQGICPANIFPNDPIRCDSLPLPSHREIAADYKILKYKRVFKLETECLSEPDYTGSFGKDLENIAVTQIHLGNPILVVMKVTQDFCDCNDGRSWTLPKNKKPVEGHAMVLVGYDNDRREFELLNSFGPDWCDKGFVHIGYDDFVKTVRYGFVLVLDGANLECTPKK